LSVGPRVTNRRALLLCAALAASAFAGRPAGADDVAVSTSTPSATINSLQQALVAVSRDAAQATVQERYRTLEPSIVATHNLAYIAEFALRPQWASLTETERQRFIAAFQRLSVMTYAARFRNVSPDAFRPIEAGTPDASGRVQVTTAIKRESQPDVSFQYLMQQDGTSWKIINIVADGVSDLALKRAEYQRLFASGGIEGLIAELEQQTERLTRG
jgi:phospholipid transport system substrate-binding protein